MLDADSIRLRMTAAPGRVDREAARLMEPASAIGDADRGPEAGSAAPPLAAPAGTAETDGGAV